jgi:hypothetical protein
VLALLSALSFSFLVGSLTHAGVRLPLGPTTIDEPTIVPTAVVEGLIAGRSVSQRTPSPRGLARRGPDRNAARSAALVAVRPGRRVPAGS